MMKTTQYLKMNPVQKKTQTEMKTELKNPITHLDNSKENLASRMDEAEDGTVYSTLKI